MEVSVVSQLISASSLLKGLAFGLSPLFMPLRNLACKAMVRMSGDVMIGPRGPAVEQKADFGPDILLVDNIYVAAPGRDFADAGQVDKPGVKIGVVRNAVPDRFLSRTLKFAELVRVSAPIEVVVEALRGGKADVFASSGQYARAVAASLQSAKIIPGAFLSVHMAVALPKGRSAVAQSKLAEIINEAKRTGVVQRAIDDSALTEVRVAPD
jgi:polar amino acid transport system substrate-binding protein